jgi:hypothetical protein
MAFWKKSKPKADSTGSDGSNSAAQNDDVPAPASPIEDSSKQVCDQRRLQYFVSSPSVQPPLRFVSWFNFTGDINF